MGIYRINHLINSHLVFCANHNEWSTISHNGRFFYFNELLETIMHTTEIKQLLDNIKSLGRDAQIDVLNGKNADGDTCLMQLANTGETDVTDGIAIATRQLIDAGIDISLRNNAWLNALDIALLNKPEMVDPLLLKAATLSELEQEDIFQLQNLSGDAMEYVLALNTYIARQNVKVESSLASETNPNPIDVSKMSIAIGALKALVSDQDQFPESNRVAQMRAILRAGDDSLSHHKSGGFFKQTTKGEQLLDIVGQSQAGTEMRDLKGYKHKDVPEIDTTDSDDSDDEADDNSVHL